MLKNRKTEEHTTNYISTLQTLLASAGLPDNKKTRVCSAVQTLHKIEEHKRATNKLAGPAMQVQKYAAESEIRMKTQNTRKTRDKYIKTSKPDISRRNLN